MSSEKLREEFISLLKAEFPAVRYRPSKLKSGNIRISPYVPNQMKNKRWMQLDANHGYLSIAMDHVIGDITKDDLINLNLQYGLNGINSAVQLQKNADAVNLSIFMHEPYDFSNNQFLQFLHKHYNSYLNLVGK